MSYMIHKYLDKHKEEVKELVRQAYNPYKSIYKVKPDSSKVCFKYKTIVYIKDTEVVGTLSYYFDNSIIRLFKIAVAPEYQGQGIGQELISYIEKTYITDTINKLGIYTIKETGNRNYFERLGFKQVSETTASFATTLDNKTVTELEMIK